MSPLIWVIILIAAIAVTAVVTGVVVSTLQKKSTATTIGNAEDKAREIIDEALKTAEAKKRESLLEVKEESIRTKNELDKDDVRKRSVMSAGFSRRKRTSIRKQTPLRSVKRACQRRKNL